MTTITNTKTSTTTMSEAPSSSVETNSQQSRIDEAKESIFADKSLSLGQQVAKAGELQRRAQDMLDDLASEYGNKTESAPTESKLRTLGANAMSAVAATESADLPSPADAAADAEKSDGEERVPQIDGYAQNLIHELSDTADESAASPEAEPTAEADNAAETESTVDNQPAANTEKRTTFREWRRENRRIAKNDKETRKADKKRIRDQLAQDKATAEIIEYNNDIKDGRIKTSKIGSVLRRVKGASASAKRATGRGIKATGRGIKKAGEALKNSMSNDNYEAGYVGASSPDSDSDTDTYGRHASGKETPEQVEGIFVEPKAVIRGRERSVTAYNDALTRVSKDIESKGGTVKEEVKKLYKPEPIELKSEEKKAA